MLKTLMGKDPTMKQRFLELWRLGWWSLPVMAVMGSPWIPGLNALWGAYAPTGKEVMQVVAPVVTVLLASGFGVKIAKSKDVR